MDILVGRLIGKVTVAYGSTFSYKERGCNWSVTLNEYGLTITNHKNGFEHFGKGLFVVYDWEIKSKKELNVDALLLQANEIKQLPCKLEATQVISIQANPGKEILLLPEFAIHGEAGKIRGKRIRPVV